MKVNFMKKYTAMTTMALLMQMTDVLAAAGAGVEADLPPMPVSVVATTAGTDAFKGVREWYLKEEGDLNPIPALKEDPELLCQFSKPAGVSEGYTIEEHTLRVIQRFNDLKATITWPEAVGGRITEKDFALFLSLHDIGKNQAHTRVAEGLYDTAPNRKALELMYSRRTFKEVAKAIGVDPRTVRALSRLLHADTIGEYLKGLYNEDAAYGLLVRDGHKSLLDPQDFCQLHILFHQIDAGSYPSLAHLFNLESLAYVPAIQEKIDNLQEIFRKFNASKAGAEENFSTIIALMTSSNSVAVENPFESYTRAQGVLGLWYDFRETMYKIRLEAHYKPSPLFHRMLQMFSDNQVEITKFEKERQRIISHLFEGVGGISSVHGANSGILVGLMQSAGTLYPTGILSKLGISPLSGELGIGASDVGVNKNSLSGSVPAYFERSLESYASQFHVNTDNLCQRIERCRAVPRPILATSSDSFSYAYANDMQRWALDYRETLIAMGFSIKQLKALSPTLEHPELLEVLRAKITEDLAQWEAFETSEVYKTHMPEHLGGTWYDNYYEIKYKSYKQALVNCIAAFDAPVVPIFGAHAEIVRSPFPILFATTVPWRTIPSQDFGHLLRELHYSGPLSLGKDIPYVFVPAEHIEQVQVWVADNVFGKKKPVVLAIDTFKREAGLPE